MLFSLCFFFYSAYVCEQCLLYARILSTGKLLCLIAARLNKLLLSVSRVSECMRATWWQLVPQKCQRFNTQQQSLQGYMISICLSVYTHTHAHTHTRTHTHTHTHTHTDTHTHTHTHTHIHTHTSETKLTSACRKNKNKTHRRLKRRVSTIRQ